MHELPPLPWLRAFEVSARHLSFTSAAQELGLSQAAISKQIKLLELKLGEPLFYRLPRSLSLTKTGEAFLPKVRDAFERLAAGTTEVFGPKRSDVLTIRCAVGFAVNWLAPRLPEFMAKHPEISLRFMSSVWNEEQHNDAFDFDIRYGDGDWPGEQATRLTHETIQPVCNPEMLLRLKSPDHLRNQTLIHVLGYKEGWALWLKAAKIEQNARQAMIQVDNSLMAFELAASGAGVALGRSSLLNFNLLSGRLVAPFGLKIPVEEGFYLISDNNLPNTTPAEIFKKWLLKSASNFETAR